MSNGTVVHTTSAREFQALLNDADRAYKQEEEIEVLRSEVQSLKQHLIFIGSEVYDSEGKYNIWSKAKDIPEVNDSLRYAKTLSDIASGSKL